jgi:hypothetical protein
MPQLNVQLTGLCLFVPETHGQPTTEYVDVMMLDALVPLPAREHGAGAAGCKVHVPHVPQIIFDSQDVESYEVLNPSTNLWSLAPQPSSKRSWLLLPVDGNRQVVSLFDGASEPKGTLELVGEDDPEVIDAPSDDPGDPKKLYYRWVPNTHRIFSALGLPNPDCPHADPDEFPDGIVAKARLRGGSLGSQDVLRRTNGAANHPIVFTFRKPGQPESYEQALASAGLYTVDLNDRLVLESRVPGAATPSLRVVFKNRPVTIELSNDPLAFMEELIPASDFEIVYRVLRNVPFEVLPEDPFAAGTRPCSCTSC